MSAQDESNWTADELTKAVVNESKSNHHRSLNISFSKDKDNEKVAISFFTDSKTYTLSVKHGMQILGNTILNLSKMDQFDRIIHVSDIVDGKDALNWMLPLLSDDFTSLIAMKNFGGDIRGEYMGISHPSSYNILCDMIARDKMIIIYLGFFDLTVPYYRWGDKSYVFDGESMKFLVDISKLMNAIKSTNTLKEICLPNRAGKSDFILESLLKEALQLNLSVTSLICEGNYGDTTPMTTIIKMNDCDKEHHAGRHCDVDLNNKYALWWPLIKKRNEESQRFNKMLVGDEKEEGIWNNSKCPYKIAEKIVKQQFPTVPSLFFDAKGDRCFCVKCHTQRKDKLIYSRGKPPKRYALPVEWVRFGLKTDEAKCLMNNVWSEWHVGFHGTTKEVLPQIFKAGLVLLKPGDHTITGDKLGIRSGHIPKSFERFNKYIKKKELFDPNQIYISPSIRYSGHGAYAKSFYCSYPEDNNRTIKVQFAFQLRIRPGSYDIGQETVGAARQGKKLDDHFSNDELEWYTKENIGIVLHGLLLRVKEINVPLIKLKKDKKIDDDEKKEDK